MPCLPGSGRHASTQNLPRCRAFPASIRGAFSPQMPIFDGKRETAKSSQFCPPTWGGGLSGISKRPPCHSFPKSPRGSFCKVPSGHPRSLPDMTGRPGCRTTQMFGGSTASYLARTPRIPLIVLIFIGLETKSVLDYHGGRRGITSIVQWTPRPVIFRYQQGTLPY